MHFVWEMFTNWGTLAWTITLVTAGIFFCKGLYIGMFPALIELAGLLLGMFFGFIFGGLAYWISGELLPWPPFFTGITVGFLVALGLFGIVSYCGEYIYEFLDEVLTDFLIDPSETWTRIVNLLVGGVIESLVGLILIWSALSLLVALGNAAETQIQKSNLAPNWVEETLIKTNHLLKGASQEELARISAQICQPVAKLVRISGSPVAMGRLNEYPDVQNVMRNPTMAAVLANPDVGHDVAENDYTALVQNPLILKVAVDYSLVSSLSSTDFNRQLDEVLASPAPGPAKIQN
jgi:hypothetical protein